MKYTVILAVCLLCACFAISSAKTGFNAIKTAKNQQNQVIAMLDK